MQSYLSALRSLFSRGSCKGAAALKAAAVAAFTLIALAPALAQGVIAHEPVSGPGPAATSKKPAHLPGIVVIPASSQAKEADRGLRAHTNVRYILPASGNPLEAPPYGGYAYETPTSIACLYGVVTPVANCNPNTVTAVPNGGGQSIAIVDAYDDPEAPADLAYFSAQFGLPFNPSKFQVIYQSGTEPPFDYSGGWELEESLDIEYAHAMAPDAMLYLVEANSNSYSDLFASVQIASNLVTCGTVATCTTPKGKGEVSMSWGGGEFSGETSYDTYFTTPNVVYFASAGDSPGVIYPSASPNVVSVGGTTVSRSPVTGNFIKQITWDDTGSGLSFYESIPSYQSGVSSIVGSARGTPDISSDANPITGVWVYDTFPQDGVYYSTWWIVGGTSASAPTLAGIINAAAAKSGTYAASTKAELTTIYANRANASDFGDITYGACYYYQGYFAATGYDLCSGVGYPKGLAGK